jgi:hypothetical protein
LLYSGQLDSHYRMGCACGIALKTKASPYQTIVSQNSYKENHYVPQWYQRRFLPSVREQKFRYLDLYPESFVDPTGAKRQKKKIFRWGTDRCFKQMDLYTTRFGALESTEIERFFFGRVDREGREAVEYFSELTHPSANGKAFQALLRYMSVQKLRTPKGLAQLSAMTRLEDKNEVLIAMQEFQNCIALFGPKPFGR